MARSPLPAGLGSLGNPSGERRVPAKRLIGNGTSQGPKARGTSLLSRPPPTVCAWERRSVSLRVRPGVSVCVHVRACERGPPSAQGGGSPRAVGSPRQEVRSSPHVVPRAQAGARLGSASAPSPEVPQV